MESVRWACSGCWDCGSYQTAWTMLRKLRSAMVRPARERLSGTVEVDESYVGGIAQGTRGRGTETKFIVAIAIESIVAKGIWPSPYATRRQRFRRQPDSFCRGGGRVRIRNSHRRMERL